MKKVVLGLILELNPFHKGHKYFIETVKEKLNPSLTVAVVSSSFTMRGEVSVLDKFTKAKLLSSLGVDLVLELPFVYSNNSADFFAYHSVKILNEAGITHLAFGSESGNIEDLIKIKDITKTDFYNLSLKKYLDMGYSYPNSSLKAFLESSDNIDLVNNFSLPNNSLAISYLNAIDKINKDITPFTIFRKDNNFFDEDVKENSLASAKAIRKMIDDGNIVKDHVFYDYDFISQSKVNDELFKILKYNLITKDISLIKGVSEGIDKRLLSFIDAPSYDSFIDNVKTRRYTENRIKRLILNIIFDIKDDYNTDSIYLRCLYSNKNGINQLKNKNVITNISKINKIEDDTLLKIINKELEITKIYDFC